MAVLPSLPTYPIRVVARALVVKDDAVLLVKFDDENGPHYNWPGGGMNFGETVKEAVVREVFEETSARVEVGELFCVNEYLVSEETAKTGIPQTFGLIFLCSLIDGNQPRLPDNPDENQVAVEWIPIDELQNHWVLPNLTSTVQAWYHDKENGLPLIVNREDS